MKEREMATPEEGRNETRRKGYSGVGAAIQTI